MKLKLFLLSILTLSLFSCEKDDPEVPNEEELITTLTVSLVNASSGTTVELKYVDLDGDGDGAPVVTGGTLEANSTYTASITLLNEQEDPAEDITTEVREEGDEHQFFFSTTVSGLSFAYADQDSENQPIGLQSTWTTGAAGQGNIGIILRHEPEKDAAGVAGGDISNAGGESDIEVTIDVTVQ